MMKGNQISRRIFLMGTAATVAGCATVSRRSLGRPRYKSPSEKLNVAGIGVGGKGRSDMMGCSSENIVALCDVDWDRAAESFENFPKAKRYKDFREMLDKQKDIDAVVVTIPDHMHYVAAMTAMQLGKHVYVQKPLTHDVWEARKLAKAARKYKVATQMGNQGHCSDEVRQFCEMIRSGAIGQVREVHIWTDRPGKFWKQGDWTAPLAPEPVPDHLDWDLWQGTAPYRPYNHIYAPHDWRGWWDFGCSALGDMGCHIMDPCNWALNLGAPISVEPVHQTKKNDQTGPGESIIRYEFPQRGDLVPVVVYWYDGGAMPPRPEGIPDDEILGAIRPDRPDRNGINGSYYIGDKGMVTVGEYGEYPRLIPASAHKDYTPPPKTIRRVTDNDPYKDWIQACKGGEPACSNFDYAGPLAEAVLLGNVALRTGTKILWDAKKMKVTNVPEANRYIRRKYRKGWNI